MTGSGAPELARFNLRKNVAFAVLEFVVNLGLVFFSYRLVILQGGLAALGVWATLYAWTSLIRLGDAGMADATLRFVAMHEHVSDIRRYAETGIVANSALFAFLALVGYLAMAPFVGAVVGSPFVEQAQAVLPWMFAAFFLFNLNGAIAGALQGLHLGFRRSQIAIGGTVLQLLLAALLVPRYGLVGLAWAQMVQYGTASLAAWLLVRAHVGIRFWLPWRFDRVAFRDMLAYSLRAQVANISAGLFEPASKLLVAHFGGMAAQGLYELAFKTVWLSRNAVVTGVAATLPSMTTLLASDHRSARTAHHRANRLAVLAATVVLSAATLASPIVSFVWLGAAEPRFSVYVALLALGAWASAAGANAYNLAFAAGRLGHTIAVNFAMLLLLAAAGLFAGELWAVNGVVAAVALALAAGGVAIRLLNERKLQPSALASLAP